MASIVFPTYILQRIERANGNKNYKTSTVFEHSSHGLLSLFTHILSDFTTSILLSLSFVIVVVLWSLNSNQRLRQTLTVALLVLKPQRYLSSPISKRLE